MSKSVLVVDDEQGYREMYVFIFQSQGIETTCVTNGQEAVEKIRERAYDLVIMDVHMPILSGPEAFKEIKKFRPDQKIIICSSSSDPTHRAERDVINAGAYACLYKPVSLDEIEHIIQEALSYKSF